MIFERRYDQLYRPWFAWRPVWLVGPDEWNRRRRLRCSERLVWLRRVWRLRSEFGTYYAVPSEHTTNAMLIRSMENF